MLSVSLFQWVRPLDDDRDENVADGGNEGGRGVARDFSISCTDGGTLDNGDSPSSYFLAKKLLSSPSASISELGELSVSVFRFVRPARERLWRTRETGVKAGSWDWGTPRAAESRGERGGEERAMERADAVSPSEK